MKKTRQPIRFFTRLEASVWLTNASVFTLFWVLLTQGNLGSWVIGIFVVPIATWSSIWLLKSTHICSKSSLENRSENGLENRSRLRISALIRFIPFFLIQSLRGGWESALLALLPRTRVKPDFIHYKTQLPKGRVRIFFSNTICLLPGTVSVDWQDDTITIHALDASADHYEDLKECEQQIASLFGLILDDRSSHPSQSSPENQQRLSSKNNLNELTGDVL